MTTFALWKSWCCGATTVSTGQRLRSHTFTTQVNFRTVGLFALDAFDHVFFLKSNTNTSTNTNTKTTDYMINNIKMGISMISSQVSSHLRPTLGTWLYAPLHLRDHRRPPALISGSSGSSGLHSLHSASLPTLTASATLPPRRVPFSGGWCV